MPQMVINVPPYEGEYEFDMENQPFTTVEWRWIKKISGYLPLTISDGFAGGDPDLFLAWGVIAMRRAGRITKDDVVATATELEDYAALVDGAAIVFKGDAEVDEAGDADPPKPSSPDDSKPDSGESSPESSEPSPESESQNPSGIQDWATGSDSDRLTLAR